MFWRTDGVSFARLMSHANFTYYSDETLLKDLKGGEHNIRTRLASHAVDRTEFGANAQKLNLAAKRPPLQATWEDR